MSNQPESVAAMFAELVRVGHVRPGNGEIPWTLPGAFRTVPCINAYSTPEAPIRPETEENAKLGQRSPRDKQRTSVTS